MVELLKIIFLAAVTALLVFDMDGVHDSIKAVVGVVVFALAYIANRLDVLVNQGKGE